MVVKIFPATSAGKAGFPVLFMKKVYEVPPLAVIATDSPSQIIFPDALVDKLGFNPTSSTIIAIVSDVIHPKLSITSIVILSPFCKISGLAVRSLVPPVSIIYCAVELLCCVTPLTIKVYVAAPVFAETVIISS